MVVAPPVAPRLGLQCEAIAADTTTLRSLHWDRRRFDTTTDGTASDGTS